ncbi:hypothetical protein FRB97_001734 [Tulasnella sp. 331]|nr:hypothetical protein FRB97_001734 [Tulasnella sp. 331]
MTGTPSFTTASVSHHGDDGIDHFAEAHGGERPHLLKMLDRWSDRRNVREHVVEHVHSHRAPVHWQHLFKRPVVRQWVFGGKLYREKANREAAKTELFFDLVFVGIIHQLADGASESATGINIAKFILIFYPSWSVWSEVKSFINTSGTDDVVMRIYLFVIMCLLLGYSANVSAIKIERAEGASSDDTTTSAVAAVATMVGRSLFSRQDAPTTSSPGGAPETGTTDATPAESKTFAGGYVFGEGFDSALSAAAGYFLVARFTRILLYMIYGYILPKFRRAHYLQAAAVAAICCVYLPLIWVTDPGTVAGLASAGILVELSGRYIVGLYTVFTQKSVVKRGRDGWYVPAINIEHSMERTGLFVILVIGESIINVTFAPTAGSNQNGPHSEYWRAIFGLAISFSLCWIYFDADSSRVFIHALRRHWFTNISYSHIHWPFCASLILMSAGLARMVASPDFENSGYRWMFSGSLATAIFCLAVIGFLHKNLDKPGASYVPRSVRLAVRVGVSIIILLLPLSSTLDDTQSTLAICAGILVLLVAFEMFGKLGSIGAGWEDLHHDDDDEVGEEGQEQSLGEAQADAEFHVDVIDTSRDENGDQEGVVRTSHDVHDGNHLDVTFTEKGGHLALPQATYFPEGTTAEGKTRAVSSSVSAKLTPLEAARIARRKAKAKEWHRVLHTLTENERGEDDVGMEEDLGKIEVREIEHGQRWAYAA